MMTSFAPEPLKLTYAALKTANAATQHLMFPLVPLAISVLTHKVLKNGLDLVVKGRDLFLGSRCEVFDSVDTESDVEEALLYLLQQNKSAVDAGVRQSKGCTGWGERETAWLSAEREPSE